MVLDDEEKRKVEMKRKGRRGTVRGGVEWREKKKRRVQVTN